MSGGLREFEEAAKILDEARRRLYAVLAGDQARPTEAGTVGPGSGPVGGATGSGPAPGEGEGGPPAEG